MEETQFPRSWNKLAKNNLLVGQWVHNTIVSPEWITISIKGPLYCDLSAGKHFFLSFAQWAMLEQTE